MSMQELINQLLPEPRDPVKSNDLTYRRFFERGDKSVIKYQPTAPYHPQSRKVPQKAQFIPNSPVNEEDQSSTDRINKYLDNYKSFSDQIGPMRTFFVNVLINSPTIAKETYFNLRNLTKTNKSVFPYVCIRSSLDLGIVAQSKNDAASIVYSLFDKLKVNHGEYNIQDILES